LPFLKFEPEKFPTMRSYFYNLSFGFVTQNFRGDRGGIFENQSSKMAMAITFGLIFKNSTTISSKFQETNPKLRLIRKIDIC